MRYIGSKANLLVFLLASIIKKIPDIKGKTFADLFAGTTSVSKMLKREGAVVISNDYMAYSYCLQVANIKLNNIPEFDGLKSLGIESYLEVISYLNNREPVNGFFFYNYCIEGTKDQEYERNYFSESNAKKIDAVLTTLDEWKKGCLITDEEELLLKASMIESAISVSNISGTYGAFLKKDDPRKYKQFILKPVDILNSEFSHECYNKDISSILPELEGDVLYLDPPYNQRQYPPYYHILETITLNDGPAIYGKTGRRPYEDKLSRFCVKNEVYDAMNETIEQAKFKHIFLSYNSDGLLEDREIREILSNYGEVDVSKLELRRYKSNSNGGERISHVNEYVYHVEKEKY